MMELIMIFHYGHQSTLLNYKLITMAILKLLFMGVYLVKVCIRSCAVDIYNSFVYTCNTNNDEISPAETVCPTLSVVSPTQQISTITITTTLQVSTTITTTIQVSTTTTTTTSINY